MTTLEDRIALLETRVTMAEAKAMVAELAVQVLAKKLSKHTDMTADEWNSLVVEMSKSLLETASQVPDERRKLRLEVMAEGYRSLTLAPEEEPLQSLRVVEGGRSDIGA